MLDRLEKTILYFDDFEVRVAEGRLLKNGRALEIEPRTFDLLVYLAESRGRLVSKEEMVAAVWGGAFVSDSAISRGVARLRRVLGDDSRHPRYIETAHSRGYRFVASLREQGTPAHRSWMWMRTPAPQLLLFLAVSFAVGLAFVVSRVRVNIETAPAVASENRVRVMELRFDLAETKDATTTEEVQGE